MKPTTRDGTLRGGFALLVRVLVLCAAGVSGYLLSVSLSGGSAVGCGPGSSCDAVLQSRWAWFFGVPVSALALLVDLVLLFATFSCGRNSTPKQRRGAWEIMLPCAVLLIGAALWFVALQAFVVRRFCPWCMAAHAVGAIAAVLLLTRLPLRQKTERREKETGLTSPAVVKLSSAALLALALLAVGQIVAPRKTFSVKSIDVAATNSVVTSTNTVALATPATPAPRTLNVFGGLVRLNLDEVPVWGSPDAPHKLVSLYDYTCHHCELMHSRVVEVQRSFSNVLAVVSLPMPLDSQCNHTVRRTPPAHTNACLYAKLGLAVWRAKPEAILPYDDWFFEAFGRATVPPPMPEAFKRAADLVVDLSKFDAALNDPWVEEQLQTGIRIYEISYRRFGKGDMPQFIIGTNIVTGSPSTGELREIVARNMRAARN